MTSILTQAAQAVGSAVQGIFRRQAPNKPEFADELVDFVEKEFKRRQEERRPWELQWRLNTEFVNDNQYLDINTQTGTLQVIPKINWWQEREVFNHIAPIYETRVSRLQRNKPILKTRPGSDDPTDLNAAKTSSRILGGAYQQLGMRAKLNDAVSWLELTGTVFLAPDWDPKAGRVVYEGPDPRGAAQTNLTDQTQDGARTQTEGEPPAADESFTEGQKTVTVHEGDLKTEVSPAYEYYPDSPWNDGIDKCRSLIHARAYPVQDILETWGVQVDPEEVDAITLQGRTAAVGGLGYGSGTYHSVVTKLKNHAIVKRYMEQPSTKYPLGRLIVVASKKLLYSGPLPYVVGDEDQRGIHVVRVVSIHRPGCFWGKSVVERLIPIQRRYNALRNRKAEFLNRAAIGQWYKPNGSTDDDSLNNAPGQIIEYNLQGGGRPEPVQWPELPSAFETEEQTLLNEFTIISGVSELSRFSNAPPGVKAGVALSIAQEQDDTRLSSVVSRIEEGLVLLGKMWLRLYKQFVQEPRILRYVGDNNVVEVQDWTASDIRSDDVVVEAGLALAESPSQRRQFVLDLLHEGLFNDRKTGKLSAAGQAKIFELLEFGNWESGPDDEDKLQRSRAERENRQLAEGKGLPVADYDDQLLHIEMHNRFRLTADYELLLQGPLGFEIDMAFRDHVDAHLQALAAEVSRAQTVAAFASQAQMPGPELPGQIVGQPEGAPAA